MAIVVTDKCRGCRFTECIAVCPVACFHADEDMVYIDNTRCIECRACIPVCPVGAICSEEDLSAENQHWLAINAEKVKTAPVLDEKQHPLPTADSRRAELGWA